MEMATLVFQILLTLTWMGLIGWVVREEYLAYKTGNSTLLFDREYLADSKLEVTPEYLEGLRKISEE